MAILLIQVTVVSKETVDDVNLTPPHSKVEGCVAVLTRHNMKPPSNFVHMGLTAAYCTCAAETDRFNQSIVLTHFIHLVTCF